MNQIDRAAGLHRADRAGEVASRAATTRAWARADSSRASLAGAYLTSTESVMMELIRGKDHPQFKAISGALKKLRAEDPLSFP